MKFNRACKWQQKQQKSKEKKALVISDAFGAGRQIRVWTFDDRREIAELLLSTGYINDKGEYLGSPYDEIMFTPRVTYNFKAGLLNEVGEWCLAEKRRKKIEKIIGE